jgi:hypothetical protein
MSGKGKKTEQTFLGREIDHGEPGNKRIVSNKQQSGLAVVHDDGEKSRPGLGTLVKKEEKDDRERK